MTGVQTCALPISAHFLSASFGQEYCSWLPSVPHQTGIVPKDAITKLIIKQAVDQLNSASATVESLCTLMNETASQLPEYPVVMAMKGVGSSDLRKTLFQVMDVLIKTHPQDDPVYQFIDRKRAQGKPYYVYMTAGANKFLRIYYGRVKEYLSSLPES